MFHALYRKYRPQIFQAVTGQQHVRITLQNQIASQTTAHAYVFCGPRGVAKTTMARLLAKAVNCQTRKTGESEPCDTCVSCNEVREGRAMDVMEIDAASNTGVDHVREHIIENARFQPGSSLFKVFIIDEVHMLSTSAFNALLKILEEPPKYVMFILVTTEVHKIPATILSRCQRFDFHKIAFPDIVSAIDEIVVKEGKKMDSDVLTAVARFSEGCLRDALSLTDQLLALSDHVTLEHAELILPQTPWDQVIVFFQHLAARDSFASLRLLTEIFDSGADMPHVADLLIDFGRRLLVASVSGESAIFASDFSDEQIKQIQRLIASLSSAQILNMLKILLWARQQMKASIMPLLPLEMAAVEICGQGSAKLVSEVSHEEKFNEPVKPVSVVSSEATKQQEPVPSAAVSRLNRAVSDASLQAGKNFVSSQGSGVSEISADLETIQKQWGELVRAVSETHHSLALILQVGKPVEIRNGRLIIGFQFRLHSERVNEVKNRDVVCQKLEQLFGGKFLTEAEVSEKAKIDVVPLEDMVSGSVGGDEPVSLDDVLREFGGEVVS